MRLLLDTNVLLPILDDDVRSLPASMRGAAASTENVCFASAASVWEIAIKTRLGKLPLKFPLSTMAARVQDLGLIPLVVTFDHAIADVTPVPQTRDPFDRLLLAQCAVEQLRLVTLDRALAAHPYAWR